MNASGGPRDGTAGGGWSNWYWRRGVPLIAGSSALAAVAVVVDWLGGFGAVASQATDGDSQELDVAVAASVLCLCLLACRRLVRHETGACARSTQVEPLAGGRHGARAEVVLAMVVIAAGVALHSYFLDLPLRFDESITVFELASQSFGTAASSYHTPNNHVLHTLVVWVAHQLGDWNRIVWRLPAFLSFCLLLPAIWWFARREYGPTAAAFTTALVACTPYFVEFGTQARGYTLLLLLFAGALLCGQSLVRKPASTGLWATWAATIGLGFFTIPLMASPAAATALWMVLARWRRCGREGLGSFALKTAGWSAAALVLAGALYAPILAAQGIDGVQAALSGFGLPGATPRRLLWYPVVVWYRWHWTSPAWVQGALLALVVVGSAVPARACGRAGALLAATIVVATVMFLIKPVMFSPRMLIWMLLVLMVLAGAGAAIVFQGMAGRAKARWPSLATPSRQVAAACGAVLLLLCGYGWVTQPDTTRVYGQNSILARSLPAMAFLVAESVRDGDYFTIHNRIAISTVLYMRSFRRVDMDAGWYYPMGRPRSRWSVHRVSAPAGGRASDSSAGELLGDVAQGRLFVFQAKGFLGERAFGAEGMTAPEFLEARGFSHELIAAFDDGSVHVLDDWTRHP